MLLSKSIAIDQMNINQNAFNIQAKYYFARMFVESFHYFFIYALERIAIISHTIQHLRCTEEKLFIFFVIFHRI
jgi:hypothetical protein